MFGRGMETKDKIKCRRKLSLYKCVPAPNIDPFRRPTMTPVSVAFSTMLQLVKHLPVGSALDADWGSNSAPVHSRPRYAVGLMLSAGQNAGLMTYRALSPVRWARASIILGL